jgi:hypothetical protein
MGPIITFIRFVLANGALSAAADCTAGRSNHLSFVIRVNVTGGTGVAGGNRAKVGDGVVAIIPIGTTDTTSGSCVALILPIGARVACTITRRRLVAARETWCTACRVSGGDAITVAGVTGVTRSRGGASSRRGAISRVAGVTGRSTARSRLIAPSSARSAA